MKSRIPDDDKRHCRLSLRSCRWMGGVSVPILRFELRLRDVRGGFIHDKVVGGQGLVIGMPKATR